MLNQMHEIPRLITSCIFGDIFMFLLITI